MAKVKWISVVVIGAASVAMADHPRGPGPDRGSTCSGGSGPGRSHRCQRVWAEPQYDFEVREVVLPAEYRTVERREWVEPVYETQTRRVWVENSGCRRPFGFRIGRIKIGLGKHRQRGGYYKTVRERVCVQPGYYRTIQERVCLSEPRVDIVRERVLVQAGHWMTACGHPLPRQHNRGIDVYSSKYP